MDASNPMDPDPLLAGFLAARGEAEARERLGDLLTQVAAPLIRKILRRQLGGRGAGFDVADLEDLLASTLLKLHIHLEGVRAGEREAPASLPNYVAVSAFNAVAGFLMAREPERTRLRDRVRYVLKRETRLASWSSAARELLCGFVADRGRPAGPVGDPQLAVWVDRAVSEGGAGWGQLPRVVVTVLERLGAPCRVESLVDALAHRLGVHDSPPLVLRSASAEGDDEPTVDPADGAASVEASLELRGELRTIWVEICALPAGQRFALLANLRGELGEDLLDVLLSSTVVTRAELAAALEVSTAEFDLMAPTLPRDDLWIAERLGRSRQQVINLRKSARLRLGRRLPRLG